MRKPLVAASMVSFGVTLLGAGAASGQSYPYKPIRFVTSGGTGGNLDSTARLMAQGLASALHQQVVVDNRANQVTEDIVAKAPPDGYTLLVAGASFFVEPLFRTASYDPERDFSPITTAANPPSILVVPLSLPANSVKELIALAKAKPGALNFGSAGVGGSLHLAGELFKRMAGIDIVHIPYKSSGPALPDLIGGQLQLMFLAATAARPHIAAGKLRALAVTSAQPSELAPGLPTVAATLPGYEVGSIVAVFAPAKTPAALITRLNQEIVAVLNQADTKQRLLSIGVEIVASTPAGLAATTKSEMAKWGKLIKELGLRAE